VELHEWIRGRTGVLSIDADFFTLEDERRLVPLAEDLVARELARDARIEFRDEHVDLLGLIAEPVDFVVNLDYHMDCRVEFLHGDAPRRPPCRASLLETVLGSRLAERYVWAFPASRRADAARVYASAFFAYRQPLLARLHCVSGRYALERLLDGATIASIFVCRSPGYATAATDAVHDRLASLAASDAALA